MEPGGHGGGGGGELLIDTLPVCGWNSDPAAFTYPVWGGGVGRHDGRSPRLQLRHAGRRRQAALVYRQGEIYASKMKCKKASSVLMIEPIMY